MQGIGWRSWRPRPESPCQLPGVERALTGGAVHLEAAALKRVVGDHQVRLHRAYHVGDGLDFVLGDQDVVVLEAEVAHVVKAKNAAGAAHLLQLLLNRLRHILLHVKLGAAAHQVPSGGSERLLSGSPPAMSELSAGWAATSKICIGLLAIVESLFE